MDAGYGFPRRRAAQRDRQAAENFAIVGKIALNLLKKDTATKASIVSKRLKAAWNKEYLINLLKFLCVDPVHLTHN
ncbi:MAG: hypothetical protein LBJ17_01945 [Dysgonamonadaceae bacterium]|nr:hypothetical protein [Dysgonamonadaceae bacterium]